MEEKERNGLLDDGRPDLYVPSPDFLNLLLFSLGFEDLFIFRQFKRLGERRYNDFPDGIGRYSFFFIVRVKFCPISKTSKDGISLVYKRLEIFHPVGQWSAR